MLTVFDLIDGGLVAAVILTAILKRAHWAIPSVAGLALYHALGRWVAFQTADPLSVLMVMQTLTALGFHFGLFLTIYGRLIGSLFALIAMSSALGAWFGIVPANGQGLALDLWNFQSAALDAIAVLMIVGILGHDRAVARAGTAVRQLLAVEGPWQAAAQTARLDENPSGVALVVHSLGDVTRFWIFVRVSPR